MVCCCYNKRRWHFKMAMFFIFGQLVRHPLIELFHLSSLFQMLSDHRMVDVEFFSNFSCSCRTMSFHDCLSWSLSAPHDWPLCCSSSGLSSPLQNFLSHQRTMLAVPRPNVLSVLQVVLAAWWPIFDPSWIRKSLKLAFHLTSFP